MTTRLPSPSDLPAYTARQLPTSRPLTLHTYNQNDGKAQPWLSLSLSSRAPTSVCLPQFYEADHIRGSVDLLLQKEAQIRSVRIALLGEIIATHNVRYTFLQVTQQLWPPSQRTSQDLTSNRESEDVAHTGKLRGCFSWPFALQFPVNVQLKHQGSLSTFQIPPSFSIRGARATVRYLLSASVVRGLFQSKSELSTEVRYTPVIRPDPPSLARQLAYQQNAPLLGPDDDPEGWYKLPPVQIHGRIFSTRFITTTMTLSVATPPTYPRGSVIPLTLDIECTDQQALDVLTSSKAPQVRLLRILRMKYDSDCGRAGYSSYSIDLREVDVAPRSGFHDITEGLQSAVWWEPRRQEGNVVRNKRTLHGEIHLLGSLPPSARLGHFRVSYTVAIYSPQAVAFAVDANGKFPLQTVPVDVVTAYPRSPRPISYSPPDYGSLHSDLANSRVHDSVVYS